MSMTSTRQTYPRYEVWTIAQYQNQQYGNYTPKTTSSVLDTAITSAQKVSKTVGGYDFAVVVEKSASARIRGIARDGNWLWACDCKRCGGAGYDYEEGGPCKACNGASIRP